MITRRSHLKEEDSSEEKIFFSLFTHGSLNMSQIAKHTGMSAGLVHYHLPKMVKKGMLVRDKNLYSLQPFFHNDDAIKGAFELLEGLMTLMASNMVAADQLDAWEIMRENLMCFISCVDIEREE
jgi:DNA-binding IclR family transcriptional regulator